MEAEHLATGLTAYNSRRWPNASRLVFVECVANYHLRIRLAGWGPIEVIGWGLNTTPESIWWAYEFIAFTLDWFDNLSYLYYNRAPKSTSQTYLATLETNNIDLFRYLSSWFIITYRYRWLNLCMPGINERIAYSINPNDVYVRQLYDYFYQYEEQHKSPVREVLRCLPLPIAEEILEYY